MFSQLTASSFSSIAPLEPLSSLTTFFSSLYHCSPAPTSLKFWSLPALSVLFLSLQILIISSLDNFSIFLAGCSVFSLFSLKSILPINTKEIVLKFSSRVILICKHLKWLSFALDQTSKQYILLCEVIFPAYTPYVLHYTEQTAYCFLKSPWNFILLC